MVVVLGVVRGNGGRFLSGVAMGVVFIHEPGVRSGSRSLLALSVGWMVSVRLQWVWGMECCSCSGGEIID